MTYRAFDKIGIEKLGLYNTPTPEIMKAYLLGVLHDATVREYTYRVSQKSNVFVQMLAEGIKRMGYNAWTYREGKNRNVYVVEFAKRILESKNLSTLEEKTAYVRGYFDAEGSIPRDFASRYYIYFAQKDVEDLKQVRGYLNELGIYCGKIHNPSRNKDPNYFRFYILSRSFRDFSRIIGSWHPEKVKYLRMKI